MPLPRLILPALALMLAACGEQTTLSMDKPHPLPAVDTPTLLAGVASVDITPPPGMPKAGYSSNAHFGTGFRTRLHARVFYLKPKHGQPVAIVQTDLLAGSSLLHHRIAGLIAGKTDIAPENLALMATHTHAAPGQFLGSNFYNRFASNESGFDPAWFEFLAQRISSAVITATQSRRPARIASGRIDIWGLTRNRSLDPYTRNSSITDKSLAAEKKFHAINPAFYMTRIDARADDGRYRPLGAFSVFSIHGTGVPQHADDYNADVWAYISGDIEHNIRAANPDLPWQPVHGAFEGTHADAAPAIRFGMAGYIEAHRVGSAIAAAAWPLYERLGHELRDDVVIQSGMREVDVFEKPAINGVSICERPVVGTALAAGASENETPVLAHIPPFAPGWPRIWLTSGCQREKRWMAGPLQMLALPKQDFPHVLPIQILRIGDMAITALPFEITTESGRRIAARLQKAFADNGATLTHAVVASVANEYVGYATTPEEYSRQFYEGGHTLYGPATTAFLAEHTAALAQDVIRHNDVADFAASWSYTLDVAHFLHAGSNAGNAGESPRRGLAAPRYSDATTNDEAFWEWHWQDAAPGEMQWHEPLARVEASDDNGRHWQVLVQEGRTVDDGGYNMSVNLAGTQENRHEYVVRWYNPEFSGNRLYRFVIAARRNSTALPSPAFR